MIKTCAMSGSATLRGCAEDLARKTQCRLCSTKNLNMNIREDRELLGGMAGCDLTAMRSLCFLICFAFLLLTHGMKRSKPKIN